jgi:hypothetical protein
MEKPMTIPSDIMQLHYCTEELPPPNEWVAIIVVDLPHGQSTASPLYISIDEGYADEKGEWSSDNDWDEGQPWAVVAWARLPTESDIRRHEIKWENEPSR